MPFGTMQNPFQKCLSAENTMKNKSIKRILPNLVSMIIILFFIWIFPVNFYIQRNMLHEGQRISTIEMFGQLEQLIAANAEELKMEEAQYKKTCIQIANKLAYHMKQIGQSYLDTAKSQELADKLNVDEIHFFSPEGKLIAGTHPQYFGYTFHSGQQLKFFEPMLHDRSLQLCQDIVPNTAEGKEMQYAAVWLEDGSSIVQIGLEPRRLLQKIEDFSLKNVIDGMPFDIYGLLHIFDKKTHTITASTVKNTEDWAIFEKEELPCSTEVSETFHRHYNGTRYCMYTKEYQDYIFVRMYDSMGFIHSLFKSVGLVMIAFILLGAVAIIFVLRWYIQKKLSNNLAKIVGELQKIEQGSLDDIQIKTGITEFEEVLFYINQMLNSLRLKQKHFMHVLNKSEVPVGVYEKNSFYHQTFFNERLLEILDIEEENTRSHEDLAALIEEKFSEIKNNLLSENDKIYKYRSSTEKYLQCEKVVDEQSVSYYIVDITDFWGEAHHIKQQSQLDVLTSLYNKRGFYAHLYSLYEKPEELGFAAMIVIDADGLKSINDTYGHQMGDSYLRAMADAIKKISGSNAVVAREGGDEFSVFLYGFESKEELEHIIRQMQEIRGQVFKQEKTHAHTLQFSMGYALSPDEGADFRALIRIADERMYQDKKSRKTHG